MARRVLPGTGARVTKAPFDAKAREREKLAREQSRLTAYRGEVARLKEENARLRAEHHAELHRTRVEGYAMRRAEAAGLKPHDVTRVANRVMNALRKHPTDAGNFNAEEAITTALAAVDQTRINPHAGAAPHGIAQNNFQVDRVELMRQRELYAKKLKELGLQDPSMPSVPSGALSR